MRSADNACLQHRSSPLLRPPLFTVLLCFGIMLGNARRLSSLPSKTATILLPTVPSAQTACALLSYLTPHVSAADLLQDDEAVLTSTSVPNLGLGHSSDSEVDLEPPSPDIKAFHGDIQSHQHDPGSNSADHITDEDTGPEHSARGSMEQHRLSTDSASAMPIGQRQHRRPPLRANSTYASRMHPRATIKMVSHASNIMKTCSHRKFG